MGKERRDSLLRQNTFTKEEEADRSQVVSSVGAKRFERARMVGSTIVKQESRSSFRASHVQAASSSSVHVSKDAEWVPATRSVLKVLTVPMPKRHCINAIFFSFPRESPTFERSRGLSSVASAKQRSSSAGKQKAVRKRTWTKQAREIGLVQKRRNEGLLKFCLGLGRREVFRGR